MVTLKIILIISACVLSVVGMIMAIMYRQDASALSITWNLVALLLWTYIIAENF